MFNALVDNHLQCGWMNSNKVQVIKPMDILAEWHAVKSLHIYPFGSLTLVGRIKAMRTRVCRIKQKFDSAPTHCTLIPINCKDIFSERCLASSPRGVHSEHVPDSISCFRERQAYVGALPRGNHNRLFRCDGSLTFCSSTFDRTG